MLAASEGRPGDSAILLLDAETEAGRLGRRFEAACIALEAAVALGDSGQRALSETVRGRAMSVLDALGCVHPY